MFSDEQRRGMYDCLTNMEKKSVEVSEKKSAQKEMEQFQFSLERKVRSLQRRRDELRMRLEQGEKESDLNYMILKKLSEMHWIYQLLGTSIVILDSETFQVTFSTSYKGVFLESYIVQMMFKEDRYLVKKHDLPKFISLGDLSSWLQNGIQEFFVCVHNCLHAFISRRQELETAKAQFRDWLLEDVTTFDFNHIRFLLILSSIEPSSDACQLEILLHYGDAFHILPSSVHVKPLYSPTVEKKQLKNWTDIFLKYRLTEAVSCIIGSFGSSND